MSILSEAIGMYLADGRLTVGLMLDGVEVDSAARLPATFTVRDADFDVEVMFRFTKITRWNGVGFFDGDRLVDTDTLGMQARELVPGDEWTYRLTQRTMIERRVA